MTERAARWSVLALCWVVASGASAQEASTGIAADRMRPGIGMSALGQTEAAETTPRGEVSMMLALGYLREPITLRTPDDGLLVSRPVRQQLVGNVAWEVGLPRRFALRLSLPVAMWNDGDRLRGTGIGANGADPGPMLSAAAGDLTFGAKVALLGAAAEPGLHAAFALEVSAPMGGQEQFAATGSPTIAPRLIVDYRLPRVSFVLDVSARFAVQRNLFGTQFGDELVLSGGVVGRIVSFGRSRRWHLVGYVEGAGIVAPDAAARPGELRAALRVQRESLLSVDVGGGAGLVDAVGAPRFRLFALLRLSLGAIDRARLRPLAP